jgi:glycosyltransferase involved in cell wall biosynthesis
MRTILHFAQDSDTSGFFPQLAKWHDRHRLRMVFGTLKPMAPWLRDYMESQGVPCFSCEAKARAEYALALLRLVSFLSKARVEILHTHLFDPSVVGLTAGVVARTPLRVLTRHYSDYHTRIDRPWHVRLDRLCTRLSHGVIAVSQHTSQHLIGVEGAPPDKVHTILNGIDFDRVRVPDPEASQRLRGEFGADSANLLLIAARIHPEKGYDILLNAMPMIQRNGGRPSLLLVAGAGPLEAHYREMARSLGIEKHVRFLGFRQDLPALMKAADVFLLPSVAEAFGLVLAEALYLGVPVIASRVGGIPEIIDDGVDGILVPPGNAESLAAAVTSLLAHPERRQALAGAGRDKVVQRFKFSDMVRAYESLYERLAGQAA